jgi:hypothetical protein
MSIKSTESVAALTLHTEETRATDNDTSNGFIFDLTLFDTKAVSDLESIYKRSVESAIEKGMSKSASVKFMITKQNEKDLRALGYSQEQIDKIKPQEAANIILAGRKAEE